MDRKAEVDRYMLAGPFSWPGVVDLLNERFVPVRAVARGDAQKHWKLLPGRFLEPGFLVLGPDGKERARFDKLTTLVPEWFEAQLRRALGEDAPAPASRPAADPLGAAWGEFRSGDLPALERRLAALGSEAAPRVAAEAGFLRGAVLHRTLRATQARDVWLGTAAAFPDEPWAWKCAAEAEGHGPFALGFERFVQLPPKS